MNLFINFNKAFTQARSLAKRYKLYPGEYVLVPEASIQSGISKLEFVIRIFTEIELGDDDLSHLQRNDLVTPYQRKQELNRNRKNQVEEKFKYINKDRSTAKTQDEERFTIFDKYKVYDDHANEYDEFATVQSSFDDASLDGGNDDTIVTYDTDCNNSSTQEKCSIM